MTIDGVTLEDVYRVEVKEANIPPPVKKPPSKKNQAASKLRKFVMNNSAGLRIRAHPTLQSEQVGVVNVGGVIVFIDEVIFNTDDVSVNIFYSNILSVTFSISTKMTMAFGCAYPANRCVNIVNWDGIHWKRGVCNIISTLERHFFIRWLIRGRGQ